jgi:hypothetical protein
MTVELNALLVAIEGRIQQLHTDSVCSVTTTGNIAEKYKYSDPDGSNNLKYVAKGQQQSHTLIDRAVFDVMELIKGN